MVDHVTPKRAGGSDKWENLQPLCLQHHASLTAKYDGGYGNKKNLGGKLDEDSPR